jgi:hypothetical protein
MNKAICYLLVVFGAFSAVSTAVAQRDAGSKIRGEYNFYGGSASRSMRSARDYSQDYRQYVKTAPAQKVNPEVAKEAADSIGQYIGKAQKHMAWMRKQAAGDKETLASLDVIDKNLADAAKHHKEMHEICMKENVDAEGSMKCCQKIDDSLKTAIDEHDKLMKRLAGDKATSTK